MWPFSSGKEIDTQCMSGFATCDGKHHTFTAWKDVIVSRTLYRSWMSSPQTFDTNAQERTCVICNFRERRAVGED